MSGHLCIHGHFYQPARENPWLDAVEVQDTAAPYHDWNERITAECYARNAASRILDAEQRIARIVNNYRKISFNVGPTLLRWLARRAPQAYAQMLEADRQSRHDQYGHGNAIAQVYNHLIMPLASRRDKITQVIWGIRDFERRFRRRPEGMWLPETAVDVETLQVLAAHGIAFTILAPHQAKRVRRIPDGSWTDVTETTLDVTIPYRCRVPGGPPITVFFYHAPVSRAIAFEGLLNDGAALAKRLAAGLPGDRSQAQMLVVATDGESYGHHHRFGEMALSHALHQIESTDVLRLTNPGAFLAAHPAGSEVEIAARTSWSCVHGIERWRSDCGCNTGQGWHQAWRGPLRDAVTWLCGELDTLYEQQSGEVFADPWAARDDAIDLIDPAPGAADAFFRRHAPRASSAGRSAGLRLLEMQRQGMLTRSSDGWFFDDISGPETVQVLTHAARAADLARSFGAALEGSFLDRLRAARGNLERYPNGAAVYETLVRPRAAPTPLRIAGHAITALLEAAPTAQTTDAAQIETLDRQEVKAGSHTLVVGRVRVASAITGEEEDAAYALVHFGGHEVHCAVQIGWTEERYAAARASILERFGREVLSEVVRAIDLAFGPTYFTLRDLPLEDRRWVLANLTEHTLEELDGVYRRLYQDNRALMEYLRDAQAPVPPALILAAVVALTHELEQEVTADQSRPVAARAFDLVAELKSWGREVHADRFEPLLRRRLETALAEPGPLERRVERAARVLDLAETAGITINLWDAQNRFYQLSRAGDAGEAIRAFGERLHFNMDKLLGEARPQGGPS